MKLSQVKSAIKETIREKFKQSLSESSYNLGSEQYTKRNMTPVQILDLAMAYANVPGKGNPMYGKKMPKMIVVANDLARLNGTIQQNHKIRSKEPALILSLLKNKLVTKDEYIKLYNNLLEKQISVIGALQNADPASRIVGGAAARQAHKDMKGEFEESVNESSFQKGKTYGGTKCEGGCFIGKQGLMKIIKISKDNPNNVFIFRDDNYSGLQPHFIKDGVIGKATTLNPSYDLDKNKVRNLNIGKDVILSIKMFN